MVEFYGCFINYEETDGGCSFLALVPCPVCETALDLVLLRLLC